MEKDGIIIIPSDNLNVSIASKEMAQSIVLLNENVWTTISTTPSTFGSMVIPANHNANLIEGVDEETIKLIEEHPKIAWKPWNPYDIITTSITVSEWKLTLVSNRNVLFFATLGLGGIYFSRCLFWLWDRRKAKKEQDGAI